MASEERTCLLTHLRGQAAALTAMAEAAVEDGGSYHDLIAFRDHAREVRELDELVAIQGKNTLR